MLLLRNSRAEKRHDAPGQGQQLFGLVPCGSNVSHQNFKSYEGRLKVTGSARLEHSRTNKCPFLPCCRPALHVSTEGLSEVQHQVEGQQGPEGLQSGLPAGTPGEHTRTHH